MPTTPSTRRPPPLQSVKIDLPMQYWELETQQAAPLHKVDTSAGSYGEAPPSAGANQSTGQTNQNQEITLIKVSADGNTYTLSGANLPLGPYTLTAQGQVLKIKSDGTNWWRSA
jgi:hypothetical protein